MSTVTPLGELYAIVVAANDWSMRDVERRIHDRGMKLSRSRIGQLIHAWPLESINASWVYALAAGLAISPARVALAAVQSMGIPMAVDDVTPAEAIMRDESLTADTRAALLAILRGASGRRHA